MCPVRLGLVGRFWFCWSVRWGGSYKECITEQDFVGHNHLSICALVTYIFSNLKVVNTATQQQADYLSYCVAFPLQSVPRVLPPRFEKQFVNIARARSV